MLGGSIFVDKSHVHEERGLSESGPDDGGGITKSDLPERDEEADKEVVGVELGAERGAVGSCCRSSGSHGGYQRPLCGSKSQYWLSGNGG